MPLKHSNADYRSQVILTSSIISEKLGRLLNCTILNHITSGIHENGLAFTDCKSKDAPPKEI